MTLCLTVPSHAGVKPSIRHRIAHEAARQGVDPQIAIAIAKVESGFNQKVIGRNGEIGIFQIMPYHRDARLLHDTGYNIRTGIEILAEYSKRCADLGDAWFVCYNNGVRRRPVFPFLHPYYKKVKGAMQ